MLLKYLCIGNSTYLYGQRQHHHPLSRRSWDSNGSKYLIEIGTRKLLVDCGLFQGLKKLRAQNWEPLPVEAATIDIVLLTHGHLDHCGYLPRLVNQGYGGHIFGTSPTLDIAATILRDSAKIQEEEADEANREGLFKALAGQAIIWTERC